MIEEDLKLWIVDTISEGGYSLRELSEYITKNDISEYFFIKEFKNIFLEKKISIKFNNREIVSLIQLDSIISSQQQWPKLELEISLNGKLFLEKNGIRLAD